MEFAHLESADRTRLALERGEHDPARFRASLLGVPPLDRDVWVDRVLGLDDAQFDDGPELPRGCVPYMPSRVDVVLRAIDRASVSSTDVFVDVGSGVGRVVTLVYLLSGATVVGLEIQSALVRAARELASRFRLTRVAHAHGDAADLLGSVEATSVLFLYCPFSGERLNRLLDDHVEPIARLRPLRLCCVDVPLPTRDWLSAASALDDEMILYRTTAHAGR
ncbi:MAG: hypothetical protein U0271_05635 [Polyangiaceae bacterium]